MNTYLVDFNPVYLNDTQNMEGVEYVNVDKENSDTITSTYFVY